ncbi:MAG: 3-phosphoshikimate 1-carboxyvinyltransferase [Actinomycetes bacterium]|jgi:3-phosphoshikimate 1-carboxyvinyltransferase|nr:MAG: 3-phosphoshikimate 1-carboxyvinyltransferase [Actinomycetota bacterium]
MTGLPAGRAVGEIRVPGSKSASIRALAVAALAPGRSVVRGADPSDDVSAMARVAAALGAKVERDGADWVVEGGGLRAPDGPLDCGESGLTARIAIAVAGTIDGEVTITGRGRLPERPMGPLLDVLRSQHIEVVSAPGGTLPVTVRGAGGWWGGEVPVPTGTSTQFLSATLIAAPTARYPMAIRLEEGSGALGYVEMTVDLMAAFGARPIVTGHGFEVPKSGYRPTDYTVPPDASSAVYPAVAAAITGGEVTLVDLRPDDRQPDMAVLRHLEAMGCRVEGTDRGVRVIGPERLQGIEADLESSPDGALGLAVACLFAEGPSRLTGLHTLRHKESDRIAAISEGLERLGAEVATTEDSLTVRPPALITPAQVRAHGDHRIAMSLALAGLKAPGVDVDDPGVVAKTWPAFWDDMTRLVFQPG